jgi:rhodanese-related sulfurtransferase
MIIGYSLANDGQWRKEGLELASIPVEVRSRAEWLRGHLPGAISMPLLDFDPANQPFDSSKPSLVYCHEGFRATTAASLLLRDSAAEVGILIDGMERWSALGLPLEIPRGINLPVPPQI